MQKNVPKIAVVGGGLAGMLCADTLVKKGFDVHVFDMGRRATGGRASVRQTREGYFFNHGLQFIKFTNADLINRSKMWEKNGALQPWKGMFGLYDSKDRKFTDRDDVGNSSGFCDILKPGPIFVNNKLTEHLRDQPNLTISLGTIVNSLTWNDSTKDWNLKGRKTGESEALGLGIFDAVVLSDAMNGRRGSPGHILMEGEELSTSFPVLDKVRVEPVFSLMTVFPSNAINASFDGASLANSSVFQWVSLENSKPNFACSEDVQCWMAISTYDFAKDILEKYPQQKNFKFVEQTAGYLDPIQEELFQEFQTLMQPMMEESNTKAIYVKAQRWGGAFYENEDPKSCYSVEDKKIVLCGDFCKGSSAENAMLSGISAGEVLAGFLQ